MDQNLPSNVHISNHPCLRIKLSKLRSETTSARDTKSLVNDIALIVGCEALANDLDTVTGPEAKSPLGYGYRTEVLSPARIALVPILRSGLGMVDALQTLLPDPVPVHHLGLFRDKSTMTAVEYYNNLPFHTTTQTSAANTQGPAELAILIDPVVATGATACAAIETLRDWGVKRIIVISVIASKSGLVRAAELWPEGTSIWSGAVDEELDSRGMIKPGLGDVGDRLFLTLGR